MSTSSPSSPILSRSQDGTSRPNRPSTGGSSDLLDHYAHARCRSTTVGQSPRRLSVFSGRSRSSTITSTISSHSFASSRTSVDTSTTRDSRMASQILSRSEKLESAPKSLFSRGSRILRRQGSKFSISATLDEEDESERDKPRTEALAALARNHKSRKGSRSDQLKSIISDPFDFHHLTHTNPAQFQSLNNARETDLVAEFSVIRASQRPETTLKGIRADDLQFRCFFPEELSRDPVTPSEEFAPSTVSTQEVSPTTSLTSPQWQAQNSRRESRNFENFSRPVSRYPRTCTSPSLTNPCRSSSVRLSNSASHVIDGVLGLPSQQSYPEDVAASAGDKQDVISASELNLAGVTGGEGHVLPLSTSCRTDARTSSTSMSNYPLDLEDVPEEEEGTKWHDSPRSNASRVSGASSRPDGPLPDATSRSKLPTYVSADLSEKLSEAIGSPTLPKYSAEKICKASIKDDLGVELGISKRPSLEITYEPWDEDIDYCYEHAAEANSNFDWSRISLDTPDEPSHEAPAISSVDNQREKNHIRYARLDPSALQRSDLNSSPACPLSSHPVPLSMPRYEDIVTHEASDYFHPASSSVFTTAVEKQIAQDALYEDYLAADPESNRHFSFNSQGIIQSIDHLFSLRDSFSPISKCDSQESLMISRAGSVARKHRSSVSANNVPDLVHSLSASRESMPIEQGLLNEQATRTASALGRSGSANYRHAKTLAREPETPSLWSDSCSSLERFTSASTMSAYDQIKSASEAESPLSGQAIKADRSYRPDAYGGLSRKKSRGSYSLFPFPGAAH